MAYQKPAGLTVKKFCLFMFFGIFATHLVYLGELTQIRYTAIRNKSKHYRRVPKLNLKIVHYHAPKKSYPKNGCQSAFQCHIETGEKKKMRLAHKWATIKDLQFLPN